VGWSKFATKAAITAESERRRRMLIRPRVAVVGGGISGLATAHHLRRTASDSLDITLYESNQRLGGKVHTRRLLDIPVDAGADTIGTRPPELRGLIDELGLADAVVAPGTSDNYLWSRGRLRSIPAGAPLGLSARPWRLLRSGLLSPAGLLRAGLDLMLPSTRFTADPSIGDVVRARFGDEVCERLLEPLLSAAYAGRIDELSARSTVPEIEALARSHRSLYLALLRQMRGRPATADAALTTLDGGLGRLIDALAGALTGCDVRTGATVSAVEHAGRGYRLRLERGPAHEVDAVVLAVPAYVAADLVQPIGPAMSGVLREVHYRDIATVTLAYPHHALTRQLDAAGFLVPPTDDRLLFSCTWLTAKWPPMGRHPVTLIRGLIGGNRDAGTSMSDEALARRVHEELVDAMGLAAPPVRALVSRWPRAIPQYAVGHQDRLDQIDSALSTLPRLYLTGAGYRGASLARCVAQAYRAARSVATELET
jgi:oxygen-dependent protoporphyrinogen oxidase